MEPKCIGKGWIRHVYFRMAYNLEFQAAELLPSGGTSIAANAGLAEIGRSQGERISAGAVQRPAFARPVMGVPELPNSVTRVARDRRRPLGETKRRL